MPAATSFSNYALSNLGPLTTTYTAPASCSTGTDRVEVALATAPGVVEWLPSCGGWTLGDCVPAGAAIDAYAAANADNPAANFMIPYHSPGVACPAGWATAGAAARGAGADTNTSGGSPFSSSGAFVTPAPAQAQANTTDAVVGPMFNPPLNVLMNALDPGETAVVCCPSTWSVQAQGYCFSVLPTSVYQPTGGCERLVPMEDVETFTAAFNLGGQTVTGELLAITGTQALSTVTTSLRPESLDAYVGVSVMPMVTMVHRAGDVVAIDANATVPPASAPPAAAGTAAKTSSPATRSRRVGGGGGAGAGGGMVWTAIATSVVLGIFTGAAVVLPL